MRRSERGRRGPGPAVGVLRPWSIIPRDGRAAVAVAETGVGVGRGPVGIGEGSDLGCGPVVRVRSHAETVRKYPGPTRPRAARLGSPQEVSMTTLRRYLSAGRELARDAGTWRPGRLTGESTYFVARDLHRRTAGRVECLGPRHRAGRARARAPPGGVGTRARLARQPFGAGQRRRHRCSAHPRRRRLARIRDFATTAPAVLQSVDGTPGAEAPWRTARTRRRP